jgi:hypothetical protein
MTEIVTLFRQFLYRDLAFILGGSFVLLSLAYTFRGRGCIGPIDWHYDWGKFPTAGIVLIAAAAYVIGYAVQDVGALLRLTPTSRFQPGSLLKGLYKYFSRMRWEDTKYPNDREFSFEIHLERLDIPERVIQELERIRSLKVISMCVGGCLALSALIFLLHLVDLRGTALQSIAVPCLAPSVARDWVIFFVSALLAVSLICLGRIKGMQEMQFYQSIHEANFPVKQTGTREEKDSRFK